ILSRGGVYYAFLLRSQPLLQKFFQAVQNFLNLSTRRPVSRCSVSVEAHYREFLTADKGLLQKND
ncbi:hypothetical protein, partial [Erwinia amylovora]|uniref:hypothetical protein n=1 Tax=Erwinia amylovora TaxID=552 RepID=UPI001C5573AE